MPGGLPGIVSPVACHGGPVCHLAHSPSSGLLLAGGGFSGGGGGRDITILGSLSGVCIPPFGLLPRLLAKVRQSLGLELTLVAPFWPLRPWFPDLLELLVEIPILLPYRRDLLHQPHFHYYHRNLRALQLTGFRIASDPRGLSDSLLRWLANLPGAAAPLLGVTTSRHG